jgi:hypothetical protein
VLLVLPDKVDVVILETRMITRRKAKRNSTRKEVKTIETLENENETIDIIIETETEIDQQEVGETTEEEEVLVVVVVVVVVDTVNVAAVVPVVHDLSKNQLLTVYHKVVIEYQDNQETMMDLIDAVMIVVMTVLVLPEVEEGKLVESETWVKLVESETWVAVEEDHPVDKYIV